MAIFTIFYVCYLYTIIFFHYIISFLGYSMKFFQGTIALALVASLTACGGGGEGYFDKQADNNNDSTTPPETITEAQKTLTSLKTEGQYLFGNYDPNDATVAKGYIDHAMDTFSHGPLQIAVDVKKLFDKDKSNFTYYDVCFGGEGNAMYENTPCYVLKGEANIKAALNKISPNTYTNWDFDITKDQLASMKISPDQIEKFTGESYLIIFDNQNKDKAFNDVWVAGVFGYPYKQSWGLTQTDQLRIVSMNGEGEYNITVNTATQDAPDATKTYGALSIYKDPTSKDGELFVLQNNSSFDVLTNDNPNTPNIEPVSFVINSTVGDVALATYRIKANLDQILSIPSVSAISGTRIENEIPNSNTESFTGSIYLEGPNIFTFKNAANGSILKFKHIFNNITYEGQSVNNNGTVSTTLTQPSGLKF